MRVVKCSTCNVIVAIDMDGSMTDDELAVKQSYHDPVCLQRHEEDGWE